MKNLVEIQVFVVETTSSFNALLEFINGLLIHEESTVILPLRKEILLIFFTQDTITRQPMILQIGLFECMLCGCIMSLTMSVNQLDLKFISGCKVSQVNLLVRACMYSNFLENLQKFDYSFNIKKKIDIIVKLLIQKSL